MRDDDPIAKALIAAGLYSPDKCPAVDTSELPTAAAGDPVAQRYAEKALEYESDIVSAATEGARNETLNRAAYKLGSLVTAGHLDGQIVIDTLIAAARVSGLPQSEINRVVYRATRDGGQQPRELHLEPREQIAPAHTLSVVPPSGGTAEDADDSTTFDADADAATAEAMQRVAKLYPPLDWHAEFARAPEDIEWLAYPILERGRLYALYSPAKAGKSLLTLDIAAALASGRKVFGQLAGDPLKVLYVDLENNPGDLVDRLQDLGYGPGELDNLVYESFPSLPALDSVAGGVHLLYLARYHAAELVVIDTVSRVIAGKENDSDTFHALYRHALAPLKGLGIGVLRLDHAGKDEEKGVRGSSAKNSDVDVVWKLSRPSEGRVRLDRIAARNNHCPEYVTLDIEQEPLRHVLLSESPDDRVVQLAATLDRLGVPVEWGVRKCRPALVSAGFKVRNNVLSEAIRFRKSTLEEAS